MFEAGDIREWRGHDVVDDEGHRIGTLESVYVDTGSDQPAFATVTVGLPTRHKLVFVPLAGATVGPGYLKVTYSKHPLLWFSSAPGSGEAAGTQAGDLRRPVTKRPVTSQPAAGRGTGLHGPTCHCPITARAAALDTTLTGDIWLFRGHKVADCAVQLATNSRVNHVGMSEVIGDLPPLGSSDHPGDDLSLTEGFTLGGEIAVQTPAVVASPPHVAASGS